MNRLAPAERHLLPGQLFSHYLLKDNPLAELDDWLQPRFSNIDSMSIRQYLQTKNPSAEAMRLMDVAVPGWTLDDASALDILRKNHVYSRSARTGPFSLVRDGTDALTTAMARSLDPAVQLDKEVVQIEAGVERVQVRCSDGSLHEARACLSTIPWSAMHKVRIVGNATRAQRNAWATLRYYKLVAIYMNVRAPFWEEDGLPPTTWTDGAFESFVRQPSAEDRPDTFCALVNGSATAPLDRLSPFELGRRALQSLVRLRPAAAGRVEVAAVHNWSTFRFSRGHIAYSPPGMLQRHASLLAEPVGALRFAGEHLGKSTAGLESACESAEAAAVKILEDLAG